MSDRRNHLRSVLDTALTVAAIATSLLAVAVVAALLWWVHSLSSTAPEETSVPVRPPPRAPARAQAAHAPRDIPALPPRAPAAAQRVAAAQAPAPTAAPTAARPTRGANDDAAKNRALGAALSRLADDPELQRKLGLPSQVPP
jgi:hypothetical protein